MVVSKAFEAMKAGKSAVLTKSQFPFQKNLLPLDFSIGTVESRFKKDFGSDKNLS